jgi:hypothetical protein
MAITEVGMKPIVFISSVSEGYQHIRKAAGDAVSKAGGKPTGLKIFLLSTKAPETPG